MVSKALTEMTAKQSLQLIEPLRSYGSKKFGRKTRCRVSGGKANMRVVDPSHVALVDVSFTTDCRDGEWGLDLDKLKAALNPFEPTDIVSCHFGDDGKVVLRGAGLDKNLPLVEIRPLPKPTRPNYATTCEVETTKKQMTKALKHAGDVDDVCAIWVRSDGSAVLIAESDDESVVAEVGEAKFTHGEPKHIATLYIGEFFMDAVKALPDNKPFLIQLATGSPAKMVYNVGDAEVVVLIAPRLEDNKPDNLPEMVRERVEKDEGKTVLKE